MNQVTEAQKQALDVLLSIYETFPQLINDDGEVSGADLLEHLTSEVDRHPELKRMLGF